ncbi:MAG: glycosyltransferase family 39 protein [Myxococcota bacterium]|jgi:4-amino-4-deoxy-L-arabinose transferase-like glycosyltransferase|nr:glycosyltransferase family 39 protein [Myxococcota bacterium]
MQSSVVSEGGALRPREEWWSRPCAFYGAAAAILCLALVTRAIALTAEGFWFDELWIWRQMQLSFPELMHDMVYQDVHPPLYNVLLWLWTRLFGTAELALRLPSLLFGVATVAVLMAWAKRLRGPRLALWVGVVASVGEYAVYYAQEARSYSLMLFIAALYTYAFFALREGVQWRRMLLFVLSGVGLLYTHVFGGLLVAFFGLSYLLLRWRKLHGAFELRPWASSQVAIALAFVPWLPSMLEQASRVQSGFWIPKLDLLFFARFFAKYNGNAWLGVFAAALLLFLVVDLLRKRRSAASDDAPQTSATMFLVFGVAWYAFMLGVPFVISALGQPILHDKSAISVLLPLYVLLALAMTRLPRLWSGLVLLAWVALSLYAIIFGNYLAQNREGWREMTTAVEKEYDAESDFVVLYHPDYDYFYCYHYYLDPAIPTLDLLCKGDDCLGPVQAMSEKNGKKRRLWLLRMRASDDFPAGLDGRWTLQRREPFINGVLDVLVR